MTDDTIKFYFQGDHERLDCLFEQFQALKAYDVDGAREQFENFKRGLEQHMRWEEDILFPLFESKTGMKYGGPTQMMRLEHEQLKTLLKSLEKKMKQEEPGDDDQEAALIELLAQHNHKEENMLYPMIDESITEEERREVFRKIKDPSETGTGGCCCGMQNH